VKIRIDRIVQDFPEAATLSGMFNVIASIGVAEFLRWHHHTKVSRFVCLAELLRNESIDDFHQLRTWLQNPACREKLRAIHGVGPKTVDYLCGLVGLDFIAVDRHIRAFASDAGVTAADYDFLQTVISYAADLLGVRGDISMRRFGPTYPIRRPAHRGGLLYSCRLMGPSPSRSSHELHPPGLHGGPFRDASQSLTPRPGIREH
jgi:hypothetical protein